MHYFHTYVNMNATRRTRQPHENVSKFISRIAYRHMNSVDKT